MKVEIESQITALLVIDMQNDLVKESGAFAKMPGAEIWKMVKEDKVMENIGRVIEASRRAGIPIFHIKSVHRKDLADVVEAITDRFLSGLMPPMKERPPMLIEGTWGSDFVDELKPESGDYIIEKRRGNAFYNTSLELLLRARGVRTLIVTGVITEGCVDATVHGARDRDFNAIVITDCVATMMREIQDFWLKNIFPRSAVTMTTDELIEALG